MSNPVISVRGVSKAYSIYDSPRDVIKEVLFGGVRHDVFWALRDVSLDVFEGQRVGIIGPNGAGKSTLLKLITGNLQPTAGTISVAGKVSAMLSLTSFLDPDETGLQNIRFNLLVNGARKAEIPAMTEEIIDFTELGAFIHAPVRTYSSGMNARLAFAISTAITPDILVVDEVLGAGDAYFAAKATMRMIDLCQQGRALLFVSHAMNAVQLLCNKAVWMDGGAVREVGDVEEIARRYEADFRRQEDENLREGNQARRVRLANKVLAEEVGRPDVWRLRFIGPGGRIVDTHYVRAVEVSLAGARLDVPLGFVDIDDEGAVTCLDIVHSEWGRSHNRKGSECRVLAPTSSLLRGGHVLLKPPTGAAEVSSPIAIALESTSLGGTEKLRAQYADARTGEWIDLQPLEREKSGDGWERARFTGTLHTGNGQARVVDLQQVLQDSLPDVEILSTTMLVDGEEALSVREREPFSIAVRLKAHRLVPLADVWLKIVRSDGFYVFWQSSGQVGANLVNFTGTKVVSFNFDPNIFGAGDYEVSVDVANGFDELRNWPASQVFDRRVNDLKFTVAREWKLMMFGPVNYRFPVEVSD